MNIFIKLIKQGPGVSKYVYITILMSISIKYRAWFNYRHQFYNLISGFFYC